MDEDTFKQLIETVSRYVRDRLVPLEAEVNEADAIPQDVLDEMKELGFFGVSLPEEYGGLGLTHEELVQFHMAVSWAAPAFRMSFSANVGIGSQGILMDGTDAQKERYLPRLASGELISAFALTEPGAGSDAGSLSTSAKRDGGMYVLNGSKCYITNAPMADVFTVMARTDPAEAGANGISAFIVEADSPGLSIGAKENKMGQRGSYIADVIFDDCQVPAENLISGEEGMGFKTAMKTLDRGRLGMSAASVGAAERLIAECLAFAKEREQFGQPIANFQLVQAMLADSKTEAYAARTMVMDAARKKDAGEIIVMEAAACKLFASEMVGRVADRAVQIFGGAGYIADYPAERFYRDVRIFRIYEGTSEIQKLVIAREMLKAG